ncbi:hypothetical protein GCM10010211_04410 [Streptomyces albospinus]|uniref:Uncharacterized protein n=1 Tax=Streptomyces albospinus TaxID=285515 RepID=A0ABQ2UP67_9ACTN|nr:hypothetical protein [Streptomyces albospinus]GGU44061.1 hypothetical protein GCM10010211_04410 [Streptomyces albospinus]
MPGDELHQENAAAGARSGPRHAAPRKPLLTRLHVPAGKAIAIAAMPSAVLMGMGLTPQMAIAKSAPPESPFKDGPCVTAPDNSGQSAKADDAKSKDGKSTATPSAKPSASPSPSASKDAGTKPAATPSAKPSATPKTEAPSGSATPSPSASSDGGLLGGIGDALGGLFGVHKKADQPTASPSPSPSASATKAPAPAPSTPAASSADSGPGLDEVTKPVTDAVKDPSKAVNDTTHGVVGTADNAAGGALTGKDSSGKQAYPCVVENKQKGKDEQTPVTLPDLPWHLESSGLTLRGLNYEGVVNVTTQSGHVKQALKFTADSIDIGDLHQIVDDPSSGKHYHVRSTPGSTSTIRGGKVTLYTERLQGNLFGLIPIVFDPEHPPPLNVPYAYFSKVKLDQAGQFGGNLHVPGMAVSIEN